MITEKGRHFLHAYDEIIGLVSSKADSKVTSL